MSDTIVNIEKVLGHLKHAYNDDTEDEDTVGTIRLHKHTYFAFGVYALIMDSLADDTSTAFSLEPFANPFVCGKWGPLIKGYASYEDIEAIPTRQWVPQTLRQQLFFGVLTELMDTLKDFGDFELVEITHQGSAFKHYYDHSQPATLHPMATDVIVNEMKERFKRI